MLNQGTTLSFPYGHRGVHIFYNITDFKGVLSLCSWPFILVLPISDQLSAYFHVLSMFKSKVVKNTKIKQPTKIISPNATQRQKKLPHGTREINILSCPPGKNWHQTKLVGKLCWRGSIWRVEVPVKYSGATNTEVSKGLFIIYHSPLLAACFVRCSLSNCFKLFLEKNKK